MSTSEANKWAGNYIPGGITAHPFRLVRPEARSGVQRRCNALSHSSLIPWARGFKSQARLAAAWRDVGVNRNPSNMTPAARHICMDEVPPCEEIRFRPWAGHRRKPTSQGRGCRVTHITGCSFCSSLCALVCSSISQREVRRIKFRNNHRAGAKFLVFDWLKGFFR